MPTQSITYNLPQMGALPPDLLWPHHKLHVESETKIDE